MPRIDRTTRDLANFGEVFRSARVEQGISQHQIAETLGVRQSAVSAWEAGEAEPDREVVFRCEEIFELTPGSLSKILGYGPPVEGAESRKTASKKPGIQPNTRQAILLDPKLDKKGKDALLATYRALVLQSRWMTQTAA